MEKRNLKSAKEIGTVFQKLLRIQLWSITLAGKFDISDCFDGKRAKNFCRIVNIMHIVLSTLLYRFPHWVVNQVSHVSVLWVCHKGDACVVLLSHMEELSINTQIVWFTSSHITSHPYTFFIHLFPPRGQRMQRWHERRAAGSQVYKVHQCFCFYSPCLTSQPPNSSCHIQAAPPSLLLSLHWPQQSNLSTKHIKHI